MLRDSTNALEVDAATPGRKLPQAKHCVLARILIGSLVIGVGILLIIYHLLAHQSGPPSASVAQRIADELGVKLLRDATDEPIRLGAGAFGSVWDVEGNNALKVTRGGLSPEHELCLNLPAKASLVRCLKATQLKDGTQDYAGLLMEKLNGVDGTSFEPSSNSNQLLQLAADLVVAVCALHSKVKGYVIVHCDILPKNVFLTDERNRAILLDYGLSMVGVQQGDVQQGESPLQFAQKSKYEHCRGTKWGNQWFRGYVPFSATHEWREVALTLIKLVEKDTFPDEHAAVDLEVDLAKVKRPLPDACQAEETEQKRLKCATGMRLDKYKNLKGDLKTLVADMLLKSDEDVPDDIFAGHEAFGKLPEHLQPSKRLANVAMVEPQEAFKNTFAKSPFGSMKAFTTFV